MAAVVRSAECIVGLWLQGGGDANVEPAHDGGGSSLQAGAMQPHNAAQAAPINSHLQAIAELLTPNQAGPVQMSTHGGKQLFHC